MESVGCEEGVNAAVEGGAGLEAMGLGAAVLLTGDEACLVGAGMPREAVLGEDARDHAMPMMDAAPIRIAAMFFAGPRVQSRDSGV